MECAFRARAPWGFANHLALRLWASLRRTTLPAANWMLALLSAVERLVTMHPAWAVLAFRLTFGTLRPGACCIGWRALRPTRRLIACDVTTCGVRALANRTATRCFALRLADLVTARLCALPSALGLASATL